VSDKKIAWVGFTANGYIINEYNARSLEWLEIKESTTPGSMPDYGIAVLKKDSAANLLSGIKNEPLEVTKYPKASHLFNFHSIIPNIDGPNYSIALVGENVLNTFQSELLFKYNRNEGYKQFGFGAIYGALFPYFSAGADYTVDRRGFYKGNTVYWNETDLHGGIQVPLNFTQGGNITGLTFGSDLYYNQTSFQSPYNALFRDRHYTYLNNYISFANHIQQAKQNIYPRFGQNLSLNYKSAIGGLNANQFLATSTLFFPGLLVNHNLLINLAHQQKGENSGIDFSNDFPFSRGYVAYNLHDMNKVGANYHFPIAYPDAGVANTIYLLRLRGNVFYDYTRTKDNFTDGSPYKNFRSTGGELFFDTQWFNQVSISFGLRYSYLVDNDLFGGNGHNRFEIILPVTFF
jgi:hypothetical protein